MNTTPPKQPRNRAGALESYDPRLLQIWIDAGHKVVEIPVASQSEGTVFRQRLYRLRTAMKNHNHPAWANCAKCTARIREVITEGKRGYKLVIENFDARFNAGLEAAGYKDEPAPDLDLD